MTRPGAFAAAIKGLNRGTAYHFRAVAAGDGTSYGSDKIFNCRECKGGVTSLTLKYNGPGPSFIEVKSKKGVVLFSGVVNQSDTFSFSGTGKNRKLGSEIKIWVNSKLATKIHTSCSQPIGPGLIVGDFEVVKGESLKGGPLCPIPDCGECKGGVTSLTLKYNGPGPSFIEVKSKKGVVLFSGAVNQSDTFSFNGTEKDGKLGSEIKIWVNSKLATKLHTSCSQPIGPGLIVGDFEVDKGESLKGGPLCPIPTTGEPLFWKWLWWWRWW